MEPIIKPIDRDLLKKELTFDKFIRRTRKGDNLLFDVTYEDSPNTMKEIGRLRELSFRVSGGGTGKSLDIDHFDTDPVNPYKQLIVWDPKDEEIIGGYRYITCSDIGIEKMATSELFDFSEKFIDEYLKYTIELGRSFVQPNYQGTNIKSKGLYSLDNLWDGLGALIIKHDTCKYFFGKVTMYSSYNERARNILLNFLATYFKDDEHLIVPKHPLDYDASNLEYIDLFKDLPYKEAYKILSQEIRNAGENIPPLINLYMNLSPSMLVFGTALNEHFGGVEETGILVKIKDIYQEKIDRYISPLNNLRAPMRRFRSKWWKN